MYNLEEYIELVTDFCLNSGIRRQMEALKGESSLIDEKHAIFVNILHMIYILHHGK